MSRKLDVAVAEALGKTVARIDYEKYSKYVIPGNKSEQQRGVPHYSTDGNAVLELIGEMQRVGWKLKIHIFSDEVWVHIFNLDSFYCVAENTMPKAVALAAYKALTGKEWSE